MKKMQLTLSKLFFLFVLSILLSACSSTQSIQESALDNSDYRPGIHYKVFNPIVETDVPSGRIEVVEMFFYACPHCNTLEPKIQSWLKGKEDIVDFKRIPAILGPSWADQAKAYYAAEILGILDTIHPALLKAIHQDKRKFYDEYSVMNFFVEHGVNRQAFIDAYTSPEMSEKVNHARIMTVKYGLRGVPAIIINGHYKTAPFYTSSQEQMIQVLDHLLALEINQTNNNHHQ